MLPKKLDEEVATSHLGALDIKLTKLSTDQVPLPLTANILSLACKKTRAQVWLPGFILAFFEPGFNFRTIS